MLIRLRKHFGTLASEELNLFWREFVHQRGKPFHGFPFKDGLEMFDYFHERGVFHCELVAGMTQYPELIRRIYGTD